MNKNKKLWDCLCTVRLPSTVAMDAWTGRNIFWLCFYTFGLIRANCSTRLEAPCALISRSVNIAVPSFSKTDASASLKYIFKRILFALFFHRYATQESAQKLFGCLYTPPQHLPSLCVRITHERCTVTRFAAIEKNCIEKWSPLDSALAFKSTLGILAGPYALHHKIGQENWIIVQCHRRSGRAPKRPCYWIRICKRH